MQPYYNIENFEDLGYPVISINYSKPMMSNSMIEDFINSLKKSDMFFAYIELELENSRQMEKEIQEFEKYKFGDSN